jgi:transposase
MGYSMDLRARVLALYGEGLKTKAVAERLKVSRSWARRVKQRRADPPRSVGGSEPKLGEAARGKLLAWVRERPDATLAELRERVAAELGVAVSVGCLWNTLRRMTLTLKKSR